MTQPAKMFPFLALLLIPVFSTVDHRSDVHRWCDRTPYPIPCKHHMGRISTPMGVDEKEFMGRSSVQIALAQLVRAGRQVSLLRPDLRTRPEQAAWSDCLELVESAARHLNRTLDPNLPYASAAARARLSAARTDLDTCRTGLADAGAPVSAFPELLSTASQLISNSLAVTKHDANPNPRRDPVRRFPEWVLAEDRRLMRAPARDVKADLVVAKDGSGDFGTVQQAVDAAAANNSRGSNRFVIYVKKGVYEEKVRVDSNLNNLMLLGEGIGKTVITGNDSVGGGGTTFNSATFAVTGEGFIARGVTFSNTAGPENHQAVAMRSDSDTSVFYRSSFEGYQDTLYVHALRQFYRECDIYGTVDFIFGNAAVVFQDCDIYVRQPLAKQKNTLTAQGRADPNEDTGISIHGCRVAAAPDLKPVQDSFRSFLGRPWKEYSRTVVMKSYLDDLIDPAGWLEWDGDFALKTLFYGEYKNTGPGSNTTERVEWEGYHVISNISIAEEFTTSKFLEGEAWLPATGVPYKPGL